MASLSELELALKEQVSGSVRIEKDDGGGARVVTPFAFSDGDEPVIAVVPNADGWTLTDHGNTLLRLSWMLDERQYDRPDTQRKMRDAMATARIDKRGGALTRPASERDFAADIFDFAYALMRIDELGRYAERPRSQNGASRRPGEPSRNTPVKTISHRDTLIRHDGVVLFEARDSIGGHYIALNARHSIGGHRADSTDDDPDGEDSYAVVGVSPQSLRRFRAGALDLKSLMREMPEGVWYIARPKAAVAAAPIALHPQTAPISQANVLPDDGFTLYDRFIDDLAIREAPTLMPSNPSCAPRNLNL